MLDIRYMKEKIIEALRTLRVCIPSKGNTEWTIRCPYCGDSNDPTHGHFAIHIDANEMDWMPGHCLKCGYGTFVNPRFLLDVQAYIPQDVEDMLNAFNKRNIRKNNYVTKEVYRKIPEVSEAELATLTGAKAEYIAHRLGVDIEVIRKKAPELKIILNLIYFCNTNHFTIPGKSYKWMLFMNFNYVGFLSSNGNCITMRDFRNEKYSKIRRYDKIVIDPKNVNANTFYNIPFAYDYTDLETWHIRVAEGTFDILSVYFNIMNQEEDHQIYFACCGYGYPTILKYLISNGIAINLILHIYSDNDKTDDDLRKSFAKSRHLLCYVNEIFVHRNFYTYADGSHEKDFGVRNIQENVYRLTI